MKVLLVSMPGHHMENQQVFPLGFGYLVSSLKKHGHEVKAVHFVFAEHVDEALPRFMKEFDPDMVGFNCTTFTRGSVRRWIPKVKALKPNVIVVAGGVHSTFLYWQMINDYGADFVVLGEGEETLPELCNGLDSGFVPTGVKGFAYKDLDGQIKMTKRDFIIDLDELPPPDYSFARQMIKDINLGFTISTRGCPARCRFCCTTVYWGHRVRMHSPERVVDDMEMIVREFGVKKIFFHDDTFNVTEKRVLDICRIIQERNLNVIWGASCRVHPVSSVMVKAMVEAGCRHICWGVESASPVIMNWMNKKITLDQAREAYALCEPYSRKGLLSTGAFAMVGLPGESNQTVKETVDFFNTISLTDDPSCSITYVLPGTELWEEQKCLDESFWVMSDEIVYSNAIGIGDRHQLSVWRTSIAKSGKRIPFDVNNHFWHNIIRENIPDPKCPSLNY